MLLKEILDMEKCPRKGFFSALGTEEKKGVSYNLAIAAKEAIKQKEYSVDFLDSILDDEVFPSKEAKEDEMELLSQQLERYLRFFTLQNVAMDYVSGEVEINGVKVEVKADYVLKVGDYIEIIKVRRGEPKLTARARNPENLPNNSVELYMMYKLGKTLVGTEFPEGTKVVASYHHLTSKRDKDDRKKGLFDREFSVKNQVVSSNLFTDELIKLVDKLVTKKPELIEVSKCADCDNCQFTNICFYKKPQDVELKKIRKAKAKAENVKLTEAQHEAIMFEEGVTRINAGAGSGKTTVVAIRVTELINRGYKPEEILLVTFTNKGAEEMREKITFWLRKEGVKANSKKFNITTFNGWGESIVVDNYKLLGFTDKPRLIEKVEKYDIIFELLKDRPKMEGYNYKNPLMNFRYSKGVVVELDKMFDYIKGHFITTLRQFEKEEAFKDIDNHSEIFFLYLEYNKILKERNFIEYQDQVNMVVELMEEHEEAFLKYDYAHLIIDEFQDSDRMQLDIITFLTNQPSFKSLMVVGDDSQSIFGFRNTSQEIILDFHNNFNGVKDINMVENFRSTKEIVALANEINKLNVKRIDKNMKAAELHGPIPVIEEYDSIEDEHEGIAVSIQDKIINKKINPEDIAVIARTKSELLSVGEELKKLSIPYVIDVPEQLLNNTNISIAEKLAQFVVNKEYNRGLLEYIAATEDISGMTVEELRVLLAKEKAYLDIEVELLDGDSLEWYFTKLEKIDDKDFAKFLSDLKEREFSSIEELSIYLSKFIAYQDNKTVERVSDKYRAVTLTTAHTSKGKEYPHVYNTISKYSLDGDREEERRLLFVSTTRAKKELIITHQRYSNAFKGTLNPFAEEIRKTGRCIARRVEKKLKKEA